MFAALLIRFRMVNFTILLILIFVQNGSSELIGNCNETVREDFACFYTSGDFCIMNSHECIVLDPIEFSDITCENEDSKILDQWICYNGSIQAMTYKMEPDVESLTKYNFNLTYFNSWPSPYSFVKFGDERIIPYNIIENGVRYEIYDLNITGNGILRINQPGFENGTFIELSIDEEKSNLVIILVITIPLSVGLVIALVSIFCCFKKKLCCFASSHQSNEPQRSNSFQENREQMEIYQSNLRNPGYIDDANFSEIDLNEPTNQQLQHQDSSPMTSYIANVAAR